MGYTMNGIDVSKYQEDIDFNKVKAAGNQFVILRAGRGRGTSYEKDVWFERNYDKAKAAGLHIGAYWYSDTSTVEGAVKEANACLSIIDGRKLDMPLYFDVEEKHQTEKGTKFVDSIIVAFNDVVKKAGYCSGLYMSEYYLTNVASKSIRDKYEIWVARYAKSHGYTGTIGMWQYTDKGRVDGVKSNVDMNICYVDYPTIINKKSKDKKKKKDNAKPVKAKNNNSGTSKKKKTTTDIAKEVIDGKWGNNPERAKKLKVAGYDPSVIQKEVNRILKNK